MEKTNIEWADSTWNPVTGCYHGCKYCYARQIAARFGDFMRIDGNDIKTINGPDGQICVEVEYKTANPYPEKFTPTFHKHRLSDYEGKKGRNIFVCSMADLFGEWVPDEWINQVLTACKNFSQHNYLFLTKNPGRYNRIKNLPRKENFWFGTTVTNNYDWQTNAFLLYRALPHHYTFLSIEPILEEIRIDEHIKYFDWVIIGAETGRHTGKVFPEWAWIKHIVIQCRKYKIPVFMKNSLAEVWGEPLIQEFTKPLKNERK